ncbi:anti-sigma factor [Bryobacter aggregatus]|uniref:anti-sigma factor n=1 Tax=Bryobacter aggregatus TaxID=360054 RepID=UPI0004E1AA1A|nr:anti-sigma factor [Bryobacter aggregatus]
MSLENLDPLDQDVLYELFTLGLLEPEQMAEIRARLESGDAVTVAGLQRAASLTSSFAYLAPEARAPKQLRRRLMLAAGAQERGIGWRWIVGLAAVCATLLVICLNIRQDVERRETQIAELRRQLSDRDRLVAQAKDYYDFLRQPATISVKFGDGQPAPPRGHVFVNRDRGVLLFASNLPAMPAGQVFEMWLVPKQGAPIPAGVFRGENGDGVHLRPGALDPASIAAIAVTLEPESGSATPTMPILLAAPLQAE